MKHGALLKNAAYYTLSGYLLMPLSIISTILMRRWLDPYAYGVIATLNLFVMYSIFSNLGTLSAAEAKLPLYQGQGDTVKCDQLKSSTFAFNFLTSVIFSVGVAVWAIAARSQLEEILFTGVLVYCIYFIANQVAAFYVTLLRSTHEFIFLSKYQFATGLFTILGNLLFVWLWGFKGYLAVAIIIVLLQVFILYKRVNYRPTFRISKVEIKVLIMSGLTMLILGLSAQGLKTVNNFLVLKLLGVEQLGMYTIALMASSIVFSVTLSIGNVLYPRMQEAYGKSGSSDSMRAYIIRPSLIMGVLLPVMIGLLFFLIPMVVHWMIPKFESGITAFKILVLPTYFFALINISNGYLVSLNKMKSLIVINVAVMLLIIALAEIFNIVGWGVEGVSLATGVGYFVYFIIVSAYVLRHWADWNETLVFLKDTCIPFFFSLVLIVGIEQIGNFLSIGDAQDFWGSMLQLSLFVVLYIPCIFFMEKKTRLLSDFVLPLLRKLGLKQ